MANKRSESSTYPSKYSPGGWVTAAQYIVEAICEKKAQQNQKDLPNQFWQLPEWAKYYRQQIVAANALLKKYDESAVVKALADKRAFRIYSLRAPHLAPIILEYERELANREKAQLARKEIEVSDKIERPREAFSNKQSLRNKLKELDG